MAPQVSIIVTCFEQARWIVDCLDAIAAQTHRDWELIVADDQSSDDTAEVVGAWLRSTGADLDARLVVNPSNVGLTATLNRALETCTGTYLAYCGGDDVWHPDLLERAVAAFADAEPSTAFVYADVRLIDDDGTELAPSNLREHGLEAAPTGELFDRLIQGNFLVPSAVVYRRAAVEEVGGWDPDLYFEDWDLFLRLAEHRPVAAIDEPLADYRVRAGSMGRRRVSPMLESRLRLLAKWLGRDEATDAELYPYLQEQSWRLFKVHPDLARDHVAVAYARHATPVGRLRRLVATSRVAEQGFEVVRRVSRPLRRSGPRSRSA